ncbi:MAG: hypothetical protein AAB804_00555 [Patescibacteria group bacterium]
MNKFIPVPIVISMLILPAGLALATTDVSLGAAVSYEVQTARESATGKASGRAADQNASAAGTAMSADKATTTRGNATSSAKSASNNATTTRGNATSTAAQQKKDEARPGLPFFLRWLFGDQDASVKDLRGQLAASTTATSTSSSTAPSLIGFFNKFFGGLGKLFGR